MKSVRLSRTVLKSLLDSGVKTIRLNYRDRSFWRRLLETIGAGVIAAMPLYLVGARSAEPPYELLLDGGVIDDGSFAEGEGDLIQPIRRWGRSRSCRTYYVQPRSYRTATVRAPEYRTYATQSEVARLRDRIEKLERELGSFVEPPLQTWQDSSFPPPPKAVQ